MTYYPADQLQEDELDGTCVSLGEERNACRMLVEEP